jgi:hypothetical protein
VSLGIPVLDAGLGNASWLVDLGDDRLAVVDPATAASIVERAGRPTPAVVVAGPDHRAAAHHRSLVTR